MSGFCNSALERTRATLTAGPVLSCANASPNSTMSTVRIGDALGQTLYRTDHNSAGCQADTQITKERDHRSRQSRRGWASALKGAGAAGQHRATPTRAAAPEAPPHSARPKLAPPTDLPPLILTHRTLKKQCSRLCSWA